MRFKDLTAGAKEIAKALNGPTGQIPLARVVGQHISWFDRARDLGLTWDQMIAVLLAAGACRTDGLPFRRGHISSAVWRAHREAKPSKTTRPGNHPFEPAPVRADSMGRTRRSDRSPPSFPSPESLKPNEHGPKPAVSARPSTGKSSDTLAFMRKAAAVRRNP